MIRKTFLITTLLFIAYTCGAQQKYWIFFCEDDNGRVTQENVETLAMLNIPVVAKSNWLNAITAILNANQIEAVRGLSIVDNVQEVSTQLKVNSIDNPTDMSRALRQIHADTLLSMGYTGKGVKIGIIDGGFYRADKARPLQQIIGSDQVAGYRNFIEREVTMPYAGPRKNNDSHGTEVWTVIAGKTKSNVFGLASEATFYLARTDQYDKEYRGEEDYWIEALEWMHDQGVRLVNSSLGYSFGFDNPIENYSPEDVDGSTSVISRVATIAAKQKGMLLVVSAGNEGNNDFRIISIPADAEGILSVGATRREHRIKAGYSSIGPDDLPYIKPEVSCYASSGTSFSAPIITGLAALIMEAKPDLYNDEIRDMIIKSSHLYHVPNNYLGYGVPDARKIVSQICDEPNDSEKPHKKVAKDSIQLNLKESGVAFHKKNEIMVISQQVIQPEADRITVVRPKGARYTTFTCSNEVFEIEWVDELD